VRGEEDLKKQSIGIFPQPKPLTLQLVGIF